MLGLNRRCIARVIRVSSVVLLLLAAWSASLSWSPVMCAPSAVTLPGFSTHEILGTQVYFKRAPGDKAAIGAVMHAGIGNQTRDEAHCAHMAEHMVLMYPVASGESIWSFATLGWKQDTLPLCGGHTSMDTTEFGFAVSQDDMDKALSMLLESLFSNQVTPGSAYDAEITRSQSEIAYMTTGTVAAPLWRATYNLLDGTPYDEEGFESGFQDVTPQKIRRFIEREYSPQRLTLVVIADHDEQAVMDIVRRGLSDVKPGMPPVRRSIDLAPVERDSMRLPVVDQPQVVLGLCFGGVSPEDYTAAQALLLALFRNRTETSVEGLRADPKVAMTVLTAHVHTLVFAYPLDPSASEADQDTAARTLVASLLDLMKSYAATGPSEEDLKRGAQQLDSTLQKALEVLPQTYLDVQQVVATLIPGVLSPQDVALNSQSEEISDIRGSVSEAAARYLPAAKVSVLIVTGDTIGRAPAAPSGLPYAAVLATVIVAALVWRNRRRTTESPD